MISSTNISVLLPCRRPDRNSSTPGKLLCLGWLISALAFVPGRPATDGSVLPPVFYKTQNSDEWVEHSLHVQKAYARVVDGSSTPPRELEVGTLNLNARDKDEV